MRGYRGAKKVGEDEEAEQTPNQRQHFELHGAPGREHRHLHLGVPDIRVSHGNQEEREPDVLVEIGCPDQRGRDDNNDEKKRLARLKCGSSLGYVAAALIVDDAAHAAARSWHVRPIG